MRELFNRTDQNGPRLATVFRSMPEPDAIARPPPEPSQHFSSLDHGIAHHSLVAEHPRSRVLRPQWRNGPDTPFVGERS
jgi:hypothetical protein